MWWTLWFNCRWFAGRIIPNSKIGARWTECKAEYFRLMSKISYDVQIEYYQKNSMRCFLRRRVFLVVWLIYLIMWLAGWAADGFNLANMAQVFIILLTERNTSLIVIRNANLENKISQFYWKESEVRTLYVVSLQYKSKPVGLRWRTRRPASPDRRVHGNARYPPRVPDSHRRRVESTPSRTRPASTGGLLDDHVTQTL